MSGGGGGVAGSTLALLKIDRAVLAYLAAMSLIFWQITNAVTT